jgi:hypothetical protein
MACRTLAALRVSTSLILGSKSIKSVPVRHFSGKQQSPVDEFQEEMMMLFGSPSAEDTMQSTAASPPQPAALPGDTSSSPIYIDTKSAHDSLLEQQLYLQQLMQASGVEPAPGPSVATFTPAPATNEQPGAATARASPAAAARIGGTDVHLHHHYHVHTGAPSEPGDTAATAPRHIHHHYHIHHETESQMK